MGSKLSVGLSTSIEEALAIPLEGEFELLGRCVSAGVKFKMPEDARDSLSICIGSIWDSCVKIGSMDSLESIDEAEALIGAEGR